MLRQLTSLIAMLALHMVVYGQTVCVPQKVVAYDKAAYDYFGVSGAVSGEHAMIGAYFEDHNSLGVDSMNGAGSVYTYELNPSNIWVFKSKLVPSGRRPGDNFGYTVSVDGNLAVVGAPWADLNAVGADSMFMAGAAYVFQLDSTGTWREMQKLVPADRAAEDNFGYDVSLSGNNVIIGALWEDEDTAGVNTMSRSGSAYIFTRDTVTGIWNETQKLVASDRGVNDWFGVIVSMSGGKAIVSSWWDDEDSIGGATKTDAGSAYIFEMDMNGRWKEVQKLSASDRDFNDNFGSCVAIDGNRVVVGAYQEAHDTLGGNTMAGAGSVYIFERDQTGNWREVQKIVASDRGVGDQFGIYTDIYGDYVLVGAVEEDEDTMGINTIPNAGSAYLFHRDISGAWRQVQKIVAFDRDTGDYFGIFVDIDSAYTLIGAVLDSDTINGKVLPESGSAYFFENCNIVNGVSQVTTVPCKVYPNPTQNSLITIEARGLMSTMVYDSQGKLLSVESQTSTIILPDRPGLYLLRLHFQNGDLVSRKVVRH